jgi:hypothetical protein
MIGVTSSPQEYLMTTLFASPVPKRLWLLMVLLSLLSSACNLSLISTPVALTIIHTVEVTRLAEVTRIVEIPVTVTPSLTPVFSPTSSYTPTLTHSPTLTLTPTITLTPAPLKGVVLQKSNCRYGPGAAYLYKYGLYEGYQAEIIGRTRRFINRQQVLMLSATAIRSPFRGRMFG